MESYIKIISFTLTLLFSSLSYSQAWNTLISGTTEDLTAVHFINDTVGFVAGNNGVLLKTTDGGNNWNDIFSVNNTNLQSVYAIDKDTLYVGGNSKLYKSIDGGANWINLNQNVNITKVYFVTAKHGYYYAKFSNTCNWSGGSNIWYNQELFETNDYGLTWTSTSYSNFNRDKIQHTTDSIGYIISSTIGCCGIHCASYEYQIGLKTTDAGLSWQPIMNYSGNPWQPIDNAYFLNDTLGFVMSNSHVLRTTDGAISFDTVLLGYNNMLSYNPNHFEFVNPFEGYIVTDTSIHVSTSSGVNWNVDYMGPIQLLAADFIDTVCAYTVGKNGLILKKSLNPVSAPDSIKTIKITPDSLNYGQTGINQPVYKSINIRNTGTLDLEISIAGSADFLIKLNTDTLYSLSVDTFTLNPFQSVIVDVVFNPQYGGIFDDSIYIYSDSDNLPLDTLPAHGVGVVNGIYGLLTNDTTICVDTIRVIGNIVIDTGVTLIICPGTVVEFQDNYSFTVEGCLIAAGTINDSIIFTWSQKQIRWNKIHLKDNLQDTSLFEYCIIEYSRESGIYVDQSNSIILNSKIRNNRNGIYLNYSNYSVIKNNHIYNHLFSSNFNAYGAGIRSSESNALISRNYIYNNSILSGSGGGGGIMAHTMTNNHVYITQNLIFNNSSASFRGGGLELSALDNSTITVSNNLIANNNGSGGIWYWIKDQTSSINMFNCIVRNNSNMQIDTSTNNSYFPINVLYSNIQNGFNGIGNIDIDPDFINPIIQTGTLTTIPSYNWGLKPYSKCINAGTPDTVGLNIGSTDLKGNNRIFGDTIDIGAYESRATSPFQGNLCLGDSLISLHTVPFDTTHSGFQWYHNNTPIIGETGDTLNIIPFNSSDTGIYKCNIFYGTDTTLGNYSEVYLDSFPPNIVSQTLISGPITLGDSIYLYVDVDYSQSYQWYLNSNLLLGENDSILIINPINPSDTGLYTCLISNGCGTATSQTMNVVGIDIFNIIDDGIKIYPNPVKDLLMISIPNSELKVIEIIDLTGKVVKSIHQLTNSINISSLKNGIYFIRFVINDNIVVKKFIKQ